MSQLSTLNGHGNVFVLISDLLPSAAILRPTETIQRDILVGAITELLWKVTMFTFLRSVIFCQQMCLKNIEMCSQNIEMCFQNIEMCCSAVKKRELYWQFLTLPSVLNPRRNFPSMVSQKR